MPEGFAYPRPLEYRDTQFKAANFVIDNESETELLKPPSVGRETILNMSLKEVKEQFPRRYEMYVKLIRELKHPDSEDGPVNLTPKDVEDMKKWLLALNSLDNYIARHRSPKEGDEITLRGERQVDVFDDMRKFLERNEKSGYLKLPTGFGKTVLFTELVEATNLRALIAVPTKLLITQTEKKFQQFAPGVTVGKVYGEEEKVYDKQATLITYDSLILGLKDGTINPKDYDLLILDEAHGILSEARSEAVDQFPEAVKLGFTATPVYKPSEKELSNVLGTEIHSIKIREAVEGGYLSSFTSIAARTEVDLSNVKVTAEGEYNEKELAKAVDIESRNRAAVELYKEAFDGQLAVAYCVGVKHAENLAKIFNDSGIPAVAISGDTSVTEQEEIFKKYETGEIKVLCNADLLIAGFDEPQASVCLNLRPTKSLVVAEQRGGRVLRLDEKNPNKHAYIVDFIDWGFERSGQVLFPKVAEAVELEPKDKKERDFNGGGGRVDFSHIKVDGIEVMVDQEVILEIIKSVEKPEKIKIINNIVDLKLAIKEAGITAEKGAFMQAYENASSDRPTWPHRSTVQSFKGFINFGDLFGVKVRGRGKEIVEVVRDYKKLKELIKASGLQPGDNLEKNYRLACDDHPDWPLEPRKLVGWLGYPDLWGVPSKERIGVKIKKIDSIDLLKLAIHESKIKPTANLKDSYLAARADHSDWPRSPERFPNWGGWPDLWTGISKENSEEDSSFVKLKKSIASSSEKPGSNLRLSYHNARKSHKDWPSTPQKLIGWKGWADLWGIEEPKKEKVELIKDLEILKKSIADSGISSSKNIHTAYDEARKVRKDWPADPRDLPGWKGWADLRIVSETENS